MKFAAVLLAVVALSVVGCQKKADKTQAAANGSVTDINPSAGYVPAYAPEPAYAAPAPAVSTTTTPVAPAVANTYTVKKGDTLYGIAKSQYGDGKQWNKIVNANPGLDPAKLKVGQTIQIP